MDKIKFETELCELAYKYGSDKCPQVAHPYTPYYYNLFNLRRDSIKKVLEMGIGSAKYMHYHPAHYVTGASLRMWRDFFPNATIYGADVAPEMLFKDKRIKTFICDEMNKDDIKKLIKKTGSDIDIFIDDGLHTPQAQIFLCKTIMPLLKKDVVYLIEDVAFPRTIRLALSEYHSHEPRFDFGERGHLAKNRVIILRNN